MIEIVEYSPEYKSDFALLNYQWIKKYFWVEDADVKYLENPESEIIDKGGVILFAKLNGEIVGTCALLRHNAERFELTKMAVSESARGMHIGLKLAEAIIEKARQFNGVILFLDSNTVLEPAISLYRKVGFIEIKDHVSVYARGNIHMELQLRSDFF